MPQTPSRRLVLLWRLIALLLTIALPAIWIWRPEWRHQITLEHRAVEMASVYIYAAAALVGAWAAWRRQRQPRATVIVPLLGVLGAMEEWSFVLRLRLTPPRLLNVQLDCFHDLVEVAHRAITVPEYRQYALLASLIVCALLGLSVYLVVRNRRSIWRALRQLPWQFVAITGLLLALASLFDLGMLKIGPAAFWEETLELLAAVALFFAALACHIAPGAARDERAASGT